jgi:hypothetical protein
VKHIDIEEKTGKKRYKLNDNLWHSFEGTVKLIKEHGCDNCEIVQGSSLYIRAKQGAKIKRTTSKKSDNNVEIKSNRKESKDNGILYHGSDRGGLKPVYGVGRKDNDFGRGFYLSDNAELGREWACKRPPINGLKMEGHLYAYRWKHEDLKILNLISENNVRKWIATLLKYRRPDEANEGYTKVLCDEFIKMYAEDVSKYDAVIGWRADDRYYNFANRFVTSALPLEIIEQALTLGDLGKQVMIRSEKAFGIIKQVSTVCERIVGNRYIEYYNKQDKRKKEADSKYNLMKKGITVDYIRNSTRIEDIVLKGK